MPERHAGRAAPDAGAGRAGAVGCDVGYGYVKAVSDAGGRACFPSIVAPAARDPLTGALGDGTGHRVRIRYPDGSAEERLVGEAAARSLAAVAVLARSKPADVHDVLALAAAYLAGAGGSGHLPGQTDLAVGLPLAYYRSQRDALAERLRRLAAWVSIDGGPERYVSFGRVLVLPQGAGVVAAHPDLLPARGLAGVVDVGVYTTDYLILDVRDGRPAPVLEACGSAEVGVHLAHRAVAAAFEERTGAPLPPEMREEALRTRQAAFEGRMIDLAEAAEGALADAARAVAQRVLGAWGNRASFVRVTLLAGGGALLLRERLEACLPSARVVPDPVFANAAGFLRALAGR